VDSSSSRLALACREMVIQLFVEVLTRARWHLKSFSVPHQLHDIARSIQDGAAMSAILKVRSHAGAERRVHLTFKIIGNLPPHFYAVDFDGLFRQVYCSRLGLYQMLPAAIWNKQFSIQTRQPQKGDISAQNLSILCKFRPSPANGRTTGHGTPIPQFRQDLFRRHLRGNVHIVEEDRDLPVSVGPLLPDLQVAGAC
jgi:hypothetical protein